MSSRQSDSGKLSLGRFSLRSFRAKFVLVVGAAVVFDLALSGGVSIWNMQRLSEGAREEISEGLTQSTEQFLQTSIEMTTSQTDLLLESAVNRAFITTQLIPAIARIAQFHLTHVEWWEESRSLTAPPTDTPSPPSSLLDTVRDWFRRLP